MNCINNLVWLKGNDIFTDSLTIAEGTGYGHHAITRKIRDFYSDFEELGKVGYHNQPMERGQTQKIYFLNEPQASYLMTFLRNSKKVVGFKKELVKVFYHMRRFLLEKQLI